MKETAESLKNLNEQLQSKEVELLQLKTEVETQQGTQLLCLGIRWLFLVIILQTKGIKNFNSL